MGKRIGMEVAVAVAEAVGLCNIDMAAVYPITPQSHIAEHLSDLVANGQIDAEFVTVESEHSAMSAVIGASGAGARSYTATSSQGLMYMHELLPIASAMRLPITMAIANRAVSGPLNILNDHTDIMPQRDSGWISVFVENGQEAIDMSIMAFKIAEHKDVMLPVNVNIDGFQLTHMVEPFEMPSQEEVDAFLPPFVPHATLHPAKPVTMGAFAMSDYFTEIMKAKDEALLNSKKVILDVWDEWAKMFGRSYKPVETYKADDADVLMLTMGSMGETAQMAIDQLRGRGVKAGLVKLRLWRPFPHSEIKAVLKNVKKLIVTDRAISFGGPGGPVFSEIKSALYAEASRPLIYNYIFGLGGRDVAVGEFVGMVDKVLADTKNKAADTYEFWGVRE
ncbi:MAG: transketolase C-terminal domain-containing protein [Smithellaceae bacterium]|jgi:pyruvate ferredoxin oxidoreductase alpha subunit|nr:transketolase C-terminal domain-containing protein [Smithellaceae bacterium]MDD3259479.1 transketolase C-terminal domain-containing protein [Smithellaceae bacterium]MDD3848606.1 transketolase C-terminal domain-containing protein [Smithellaceae bacterium]HOG12296.1 transketolase C-terminal domain-containing protein [Smithellaceae bacterium]HOQ72378.1 transketolase C-terminal domain-containing protein [Smithellaceae bacterium]